MNDSTASLGPPDKKQHFDNHGKVNKVKEKTKKGQSKTASTGGIVDVDNGGRHEVEVRYHNGVWYKGWFNCSTGKWIVKFYDDDEI